MESFTETANNGPATKWRVSDFFTLLIGVDAEIGYKPRKEMEFPYLARILLLEVARMQLRGARYRHGPSQRHQ